MGVSGLTLRDLFSGIGRHGSKPAVVFGSETLTYAELARESRDLAAYLRTRGVGPGTPTALAMSNRPEFVIADQALILLGAAKVPINDMLAEAEVAYILRDSGAQIVLTDEALLPLVDGESNTDRREIILLSEGSPERADVRNWSDVLDEGALGPLDNFPPVTPDALGMILYTGGTTGRQKGVVHTQGGLAVNMLAHVIEMGLGDDERLLVATPLPHAAGLIAQAGLLRGATIHLEARFEAGAAIEQIERHRLTFAFMVPTMIYRLLDAAQERGPDLSSIRTILYGAAPMSRPRLEQGLAMLGPVFMQLYGQSEAPDFLTRLTREDHILDDHRLLGSCGRRATLMEVAVVDDHGRRLSPGEVGEVVGRGPYLMEGYHNLPEETAKALKDGWLHTGDLGWMDPEGYLYLVDRLKDMIISGGMNVYSTEVEQVISRCEGIAQVAVIGIPHEDWGESVVAVVVAAEGFEVDESAIVAVCRRELAAYKRPKQIVSTRSLPLTPYGKVDKKELRTRVAPLGSRA
jgi:fatty-acyl-CoA synthase